MEIQDFLIAAIQNIVVLVNKPVDRISKSIAQVAVVPEAKTRTGSTHNLLDSLRKLLQQLPMALRLKQPNRMVQSYTF